MRSQKPCKQRRRIPGNSRYEKIVAGMVEGWGSLAHDNDDSKVLESGEEDKATVDGLLQEASVSFRVLNRYTCYRTNVMLDERREA